MFEQLKQLCLAGYDSTKTRPVLDELGCDAVISTKGTPLHAGARWVVERTTSWHNRGFKKLFICTERHTPLFDAFIALVGGIITLRRLIREAWTTHRWDIRPHPSAVIYPRNLIAAVLLANLELKARQLAGQPRGTYPVEAPTLLGRLHAC